MPEHSLDLRDVRVSYTDGPPVLSLDALSVETGDRVAVIGSSGCGKTTLLRFVNGYVPGSASRVEVLGQELGPSRRPRPLRGDRARRRRVGFVFQGFHLIERASVYDNVLWGRLGRVGTLRSLVGRFPQADRRAAMEAIDEVGLSHKADQRADRLSGGQRQRVGVARVVAQEAELILADEPVSNLDPRLADDVLELLVGVSTRHGATLLMSLHQPELARRWARRVVGLRDGRLVWDGTADRLDERAVAEIYGSDEPDGGTGR